MTKPPTTDAVHTAHRRPREQLFRHGVETLSDCELLMALIGSGSAGRPVATIAAELLDATGGLKGLADCPWRRLRAIPGVGEAGVGRIIAAVELGRRALAPTQRSERYVSSPEDAGALACARLGRQTREVFAVLCLSTRNELLAFEILFFGTVDQAPVYPREVAAYALRHQATSVILAHNHPSGHLEPSRQDLAVTNDIAKALALFDIRTVDHIICADSRYISLSQTGQM